MLHRLKLVGLFALQVVLGAALFVLVGLAALGLKLFVDVLKQNKVPEIIYDMVHYLELFVFMVDAFCFVMFVSLEAIIFVRRMWAEVKVPISAEVRGV